MVTKPFEWIAIWTELDSEGNEKKSTMVADGRVMAKDQNGAVVAAARAIPEAYADKLDEVDILVRPF